jgi:hypothetical protein
MDDYYEDVLYFLRRGTVKSLPNLEGLYLEGYGCDFGAVPDAFDPLGTLFDGDDDFKNLKYLTLDFHWEKNHETGVQGAEAFIKVANACPNLVSLTLGDWFNQPQRAYEPGLEEIVEFNARVFTWFYILDTNRPERNEPPLLPNLKYLNFENTWYPHEIEILPGMGRIICDYAKRLWPNAIITGND